jgi:hypothetical protein
LKKRRTEELEVKATNYLPQGVDFNLPENKNFRKNIQEKSTLSMC